MKRLLFFLGVVLLGAVQTNQGTGQATKAKPEKANDDVQDFVLLGDTRPILVRLHIRIDDQPFPTVWNGFMQHLFDYLDFNGDGNLDKNELERVPSAELFLGRGISGVQIRPDERLRARVPLAKNQEGKVTIAELSDYYRKHGLAPLQLQIGATPKTMATGSQAMGGMMMGKGGKSLGGQKQWEEPASGAAVARTTFALMDTSKDGKLTAKQLAAAPAALLRADRNDDDLVTLQEMEAHALLQPTGPPDAGSVVLVGPSVPADELVRRLQDRYGPTKLALTQKDLGLDDATFKELDKNMDGKLDKHELVEFGRRLPDLELTFRFSTKGKETPVELHGKSRPSPLAGIVEEKEGLVGLQLGSVKVQLSQGANMIRPDGLGRFFRADIVYDQADSDRKGFVTEANKERLGQFSGHFKMIDRDNDGKVTQKELVAYIHRLSELQVRATASCVSLVFIDLGRGLFDLLDADRDGTLTVKEMLQAPKLLERFDKAGKGYLTEHDLPRTWHLLVRRGPAGGLGFNALGDGGFALNFYGGPPAPRPNKGPLWFHQMDHNGDGYLSRREFLGTGEQFREFDTDGDGLISIEEAILADAALRKKK
jgi:Ca2+-binding EF-hand superfamily protein